MAGADRSRVIGWGPFALPGEQAAVKRARDETRQLLADAGLIGSAEQPAVEEAEELDYDPRTRVRRFRVGDEIIMVGEEAEAPRGLLIDYKQPPEPQRPDDPT